MKNLKQFHNSMMSGGMAIMNLNMATEPNLLRPIEGTIQTGTGNDDHLMYIAIKRYVEEHPQINEADVFMMGYMGPDIWKLMLCTNEDKAGDDYVYDYKTAGWRSGQRQVIVNRALDWALKVSVPVLVTGVVFGLLWYLISNG